MNFSKNVIRAAITLTLAGAAGSVLAFELTSAEVKAGGGIALEQVFKGFGCEGGNVSPSLTWRKAPKDAKSFALLVHDPDAPTGGAGWWHWVVFNIPASATGLDKGAGTADGAKLPAGSRQAKTDFGAPGWGGPCPPAGHGSHRYMFTLHALKTDKLDIPEGASASLAGFMINANSIGKATLMGRYARKK